ncbi:PD-(D/E)XK nuclease family transposase, partial [Parabacteroides goldsteinii]
ETLNEVYLEMPKFVLPLSECKTIYLKWLYVLNNIEIMERLPDELNNQLFQKLKSIVEIERMSANERLEYELSLAVERDLLSAIDASFEDGEIKGEEKGIKKGIKQGREEERREIAQNLKSLGLSLEDISKATGLTSEEIEQL